jgi:hypothetical protein
VIYDGVGTFCGMMAKKCAISLRESVEVLVSPIKNLPEVAFNSPERIRNRVVLPVPLAPSRHVRPLLGMTAETSSKTVL